MKQTIKERIFVGNYLMMMKILFMVKNLLNSKIYDLIIDIWVLLLFIILIKKFTNNHNNLYMKTWFYWNLRNV